MKFVGDTAEPFDAGDNLFTARAWGTKVYGWVRVIPSKGRDENGKFTVLLKKYVRPRLVQSMHSRAHRTFFFPPGGDHMDTGGQYVQDGIPFEPVSEDLNASTDDVLQVHLTDSVGIDREQMNLFSEITFDFHFAVFLQAKVADCDWKTIGRLCWHFAMALRGSGGVPVGSGESKYEDCTSSSPNAPPYPVAEEPPPPPPWILD